MYTTQQYKSTWRYILEIILMTYILLYFYHSVQYNTMQYNTQVINPWPVKKAMWKIRYLCQDHETVFMLELWVLKNYNESL
jgi:hypothetical protein